MPATRSIRISDPGAFLLPGRRRQKRIQSGKGGWNYHETKSEKSAVGAFGGLRGLPYRIAWRADEMRILHQEEKKETKQAAR